MEIINHLIASKLKKVRMVGEGHNEILDIREAMRAAEDRGLDLVLVSTTSIPPVVRIQDFKKLEYEKKKARKASKASTSTLKELQFKVNISDHDLGTKVQKIKEFLERGDKVKIMVRLKGREKENPNRAYELLDKIGGAVECKYNPIKGPIAMALLEPTKAPIKPKEPKESQKIKVAVKEAS